MKHFFTITVVDIAVLLLSVSDNLTFTMMESKLFHILGKSIRNSCIGHFVYAIHHISVIMYNIIDLFDLFFTFDNGQ